MRYITINITLYNSCVMRKENGMGEENLNCQIRRSDKYNMWRLMVLGRDNFTCQFCGASLQLVHNALTKLKNNNLVENVGYGKWKFVI